MMHAASVEPRAFDTSEPRWSEAMWLPFFATTPQWEVTARSIVVVSPHPDDETLAAGGLMRAVMMRGGDVTVISVTDGENACPGERYLAFRRRAELSDALSHLGVAGRGIHVARLGLPDGGVSHYENSLAEVLMALCASRDLIIAPLERDGHADHEAVGRACIRVAGALQIPLARYPIWAWYQGGPQLLARYQWRRFELDAGLQRCKAQAIECFRSQLAEPGGEAIVPDHVLQYFSRPFEAFAF
jgi:LmbE family N-acetylglucosaminyl deacetylase